MGKMAEGAVAGAIGGTSLLVGIGASIAAAVQRKKAEEERRKKQGIINEQDAYNEGVFDKLYYRDITQATDFQNTARILEENQRKRDAQNNAQALMTGEAGDSLLAKEEVGRRAFSDTLADMASNATMNKQGLVMQRQNLKNGYFGQNLGMQQELSDFHKGKSDKWAQTAENAYKLAAAGMMDAAEASMY